VRDWQDEPMTGLASIVLDVQMPINELAFGLSLCVMWPVCCLAGFVGLWLSFRRKGSRVGAVVLAVVAMWPSVGGVLFGFVANGDYGNVLVTGFFIRGGSEQLLVLLVGGIPFLLGIITLVRVYYLRRQEKKQQRHRAAMERYEEKIRNV